MTAAQAWDCAEGRLSLGVYVLGAIDPAERALADAHLAACRDCRDEVAGLAGLPALLARVNPDEAGRIGADDTVSAAAGESPAGELPGTVPLLAQARRRRDRWRYLAVAAAVAAVAGGLFGGLRAAGPTRTVVVPFSAGTGGWHTAQAESRATGAGATVAYAREMWGTAVQVLVDHIPVGTTCRLWAVHPDGTRTQAAAWTTAPDEGRVWYAGSTPSSAGPVSTFEITAGNRVLLAVTPALSPGCDPSPLPVQEWLAPSAKGSPISSAPGSPAPLPNTLAGATLILRRHCAGPDRRHDPVPGVSPARPPGGLAAIAAPAIPRRAWQMATA
jgi:Putative zinc-finger